MQVHEEAETAKTVDNISSDANQNDEIPASTLQTSLGKEEGSLQIKDVTPADPTASEAKGKDEALMIKDRESENNEMLAEVKDKKETESSKHEEVENTMQKNESVEYLEESTGTEKDDSSKTAGTDRHELVESPQHNVKEEITENDEQIAEKSNSEVSMKFETTLFFIDLFARPLLLNKKHFLPRFLSHLRMTKIPIQILKLVY